MKPKSGRRHPPPSKPETVLSRVQSQIYSFCDDLRVLSGLLEEFDARYDPEQHSFWNRLATHMVRKHRIGEEKLRSMSPEEVERILRSDVQCAFHRGAGIHKEKPPKSGLEAPKYLYWKEIRHELPPRLWQLLNQLWEQDKVKVETVVRNVWQDEGETVKQSTIHATLSRLNSSLMTIGVPITIRIKNGYFVQDA